jgi:uncharacterized protein YbjQ (UPF0145 family)
MPTPSHLTGLSGNEIYCLRLKGLTPHGLLVGNSVQSMGLLGGLRSAFKGIIGGEVAPVTQVIHQGREAAFERLVAEAKQSAVNGVVGVTSELRALGANSEFLFVGSGVRNADSRQGFFTSAGDAQELYCHMDAGYEPVEFVFGNIAYSVGAVGGLIGTLRTLGRGEVKEFSDVFNQTRHQALARLTAHAAQVGANAVVGVRTHILRFAGFHEMYMAGTATRQPLLPAGQKAVVSSDLTGEELWAMASLGFMPLKLLISTSVYSLGVVGGVLAALKGFARGEINELTTLVYDAREQVFERMEREAKALGAEQVVGVKTYIVELGSSLIEIFCVGTAVRQIANAKVLTQSLPVQAVIRDRDTWVSGEIAFDSTVIRAGG